MNRDLTAHLRDGTRTGSRGIACRNQSLFRYLARSFSQAMHFAKPSLVLFLGDLFDEGEEMNNQELEWTMQRFKNIYDLPASVQVCWGTSSWASSASLHSGRQRRWRRGQRRSSVARGPFRAALSELAESVRPRSRHDLSHPCESLQRSLGDAHPVEQDECDTQSRATAAS